ncbi:DUF5776 domain-containing protein [Lentilactobacillus rapi]|nr:DUF5776 domain-containing protein [Lentilactobacillus rapi]
MMKRPVEFNQKSQIVRWLTIFLVTIFAMVTVSVLNGGHGAQAADNEVKATNTFNIPKRPDLQFTYVHRPFNKLSGAGLWEGSDYAAQISADEAGKIDYWMPDYGLQLFIYHGNFADKYKDINEFRAKLTKNDMKTIKVIHNTDDLQVKDGKPTLYYQAMMGLYTLEGLQYATNLETIIMVPSSKLSATLWGQGLKDIHGNLWDISALKNLNNLKTVRLFSLSVTDVSALANKPKLTELNLMFNQIADLSPLETNRGNPGLDLSTGFSYQHILLTPVTLNKNLKQYTTPSFIIKDLAADNLPVRPFDPINEFNDYPSLYPSTADSANVDTTTLTWTNFLPDQGQAYGSLSSHWKDPNSDFEGWIMVPYTLKDGVGNVSVNYQLLKSNGELITLGPGDMLSGDVGSSFNVLTDEVPEKSIARIEANGYEQDKIIGGSGKYSDYIEHNGMANVVDAEGKFTNDPQQLTVLFSPRTVHIPVNYVDSDGKPVANINDGNLNGKVDMKISATDIAALKKTINGYTFSYFEGMDGKKIDDLTTLTYGDLETGLKVVYTKSNSPTPETKPDTNANPGAETTKPDSGSSTTENQSDSATGGKTSKKGEAVYALKKIYLYKNKDFKKSERIASYAQKPRINRPMFVVTDYAKSQAGATRYKVRDVNHHSKTAGMIGYITANWKYVRPVYYHSLHQTITVINPNGVNEYQNKNLTGKVKNFKQGTQLKVKGFVTHNLTTRYQLNNGNYVTANRKLVISGKLEQPTKIKAKKTIYRYSNANFGKRISKVKKGTVLKVKKWTYSKPYSLTSFGTKRYQVAGGYVTGNPAYVKIIK